MTDKKEPTWENMLGEDGWPFEDAEVASWPRRVGTDLVWACCVSSIGPVCQHRSTPTS